jgi:hypothetical protein
MRWLVAIGAVALVAGCGGTGNADKAARAACGLPDAYPIQSVDYTRDTVTYWFDTRFVTLAPNDSGWATTDRCQSR